MTESDKDRYRQDDIPPPITSEGEADRLDPSAAAVPPDGDEAQEVEDPDQTVGTGSAIALGCIAATLLLIVVGLAFLAIVALLN